VRPFRLLPAALLLGVLALTVAACGDDDDEATADSTTPGATTAPGETTVASTAPADSTTTSATPTTVARVPGEAGALPTVTGDTTAAPVIQLPDVDPPANLTANVVTEGGGEVVQVGDLLEVNYTGVIWGSGQQFDASWDRGQTAKFSIGVGQVIPGWDEAIPGKTIGSRVVLVIPPAQGYGEAGNPQAGIAGTDTLVFVVDLVSRVGSTIPADGVQGPGDTSGTLPGVSGPVDAEPVIAIPAGKEPPAEFASMTIIAGNGPPVESGQTVKAQYVGVKWADGSQIDSTWDRGQTVEMSIGTGQVIPGLDRGLVGVTAGSRVLLVIPPADGYGEAGVPDAGITATDTLVFVVDVLASY
jgi:FKBP-type peptidyl-prolyl cis-trans isomerase